MGTKELAHIISVYSAIAVCVHSSGVDIIITHNIALFILFVCEWWPLPSYCPTMIFLSTFSTFLGISIKTDSIHSLKYDISFLSAYAMSLLAYIATPPPRALYLCFSHIEYPSLPYSSQLSSCNQGPVSISDKTSYRNISWSHEAARLVIKLPHLFEIRQARRQYCCRSACQISRQSYDFKYKSGGFETLRACQISKWCGNSNYQSRGFYTSRDLTTRRLISYWNRSLIHINTYIWAM